MVIQCQKCGLATCHFYSPLRDLASSMDACGFPEIALQLKTDAYIPGVPIPSLIKEVTESTKKVWDMPDRERNKLFSHAFQVSVLPAFQGLRPRFMDNPECKRGNHRFGVIIPNYYQIAIGTLHRIGIHATIKVQILVIFIHWLL